jgi:hypothetical protein
MGLVLGIEFHKSTWDKTVFKLALGQDSTSRFWRKVKLKKTGSVKFNLKILSPCTWSLSSKYGLGGV